LGEEIEDPYFGSGIDREESNCITARVFGVRVCFPVFPTTTILVTDLAIRWPRVESFQVHADLPLQMIGGTKPGCRSGWRWRKACLNRECANFPFQACHRVTLVVSLWCCEC